MTSLKAQLASIAQSNPDASRLKPSARRDSYIYSPSQAARLTLEQIHEVGADGIHQLAQMDRSFQRFESPLFGEASKRVDRTIIDPTQSMQLCQKIEQFLIHLAPHLLSKPSAHALEWLVRRFR
ncbi:hypothetical protein BY996DRAFT_4583095 [Phakopsora pachyrhizi]|uniref:U3 small nucleolar RNA-associated protein 10 n=1 Tax=Phakopsora pachyrhizi TaxID=170000 RepID=A0AAV0AUD6_PHAPC|nr:hypothetical protein BY996DRAFT_4583095 [Phakopsora pachyrhizi]CAH7671668.1 hypothetical protein PPACK8108_LOCUS6468 [Phakopsora pachyrhizi]